MLKKILLLFCLSFGEFAVASNPPSDGWAKKLNNWSQNWVATHSHEQCTVVALAIPATIIAVTYVIVREPNQKKIERAQAWSNGFNEFIKPKLSAIKTSDGLKRYIESLPQSNFKAERKLYDDITFSCDELEARYNSPLKPWNWTEPMKQAHEQIHQVQEMAKMLEIMKRYKSFITAQDTMDMSKLVTNFIEGESAYPWYSTAQLLESDMKTILTMQRNNFACQNLLYRELGNALQKIRRSDQFIQEKRSIIEMQQKERQIRIAEAHVVAALNQASAATKQAEAQVQQAQNSTENNNIEKERLKIEKERLSMERAKFLAAQQQTNSTR